jgi:pyruvate, water dikinase
LKRGTNGLTVIMMCELPTNALLASSYLEYFDGMSIGSNDMTQLCLGLDRDSAIVARGFDERDEAVRMLLAMAITACNKAGKYVGICGQGPSDHPDLARWLVDQGIKSMSLNPDTVVETWLFLAQGTPARAGKGGARGRAGKGSPAAKPRAPRRKAPTRRAKRGLRRRP